MGGKFIRGVCRGIESVNRKWSFWLERGTEKDGWRTEPFFSFSEEEERGGGFRKGRKKKKRSCPRVFLESLFSIIIFTHVH